MAEILLSSEAFIKQITNISDNTAGRFILPSLREAQEMGLRSILGDALMAKLKKVVREGALRGSFNLSFNDDWSVTMNGENEPYRLLLGKCQYYLAYMTIFEVANKVSYKIGNFGVTKSTDENAQVASPEEISQQRYYYQSKADACRYDLQQWLLARRSDYPELTENACHRMAANLYSAASCGINLGGARGKIIRR